MQIITKMLLFLFITLHGANTYAANTKISVRLKWLHQFQFAGFYAAKEKGFYQAEGLDVTINQRDTKTSPFHDVLSGRDTFAVADSTFFYQRLRGKPIVLVSTIYQHSPLVLITLAKNNIVSPLELRNKRVMYQVGVDDAVISALFGSFRMTGKNYIAVPNTFKPDALLSKNIAAMSAYAGNQTFYYQQKNIPINIISPANYGIDLYGDLIFTTENAIKKDPSTVTKFRRATLKGWEYAVKHPKEISRLIYDKYTQRKSIEGLEHEAQHISRAVASGGIKIGHISQNRVNYITNMYKHWDQKVKDNTLGKFYYTDYVKQMNFTIDRRTVLIISTLFFFVVLILFLNHRRKIKIIHESFLDQEVTFKGNIITSISHELRTPLTSIRSSLWLINKALHENKDEKLKYLFEACEKNCALMSEILNDIMDTEKIAKSKVELKFQDVDIHQIFIDAPKRYQSFAEKHLSKYVINDTVKKPIIIRTDPNKLEQVYLNILTNAAKYSDDNTDVTIHLTIEGDKYIVAVNDRGNGIPKELMPELFKSFSRLDTVSTHKKDGTGLGLYISKKFTEALGGNIYCKSTEGVGTTFFIELPLKSN